MNMRKKAGLLAVEAMLTLSISAGAADNPNNLMITADSLSYDGTSGKADAVGNVVITQADKTMTGASFESGSELRQTPCVIVGLASE